MGLAIALIEPQIPPNTGNIARLCAATDTALHVIRPLGFALDDPQLERAGLDYWEHVDLWVHPSWPAFRRAVARERCLYFSAHGTRPHFCAPYRANSVLVFGNETQGMPVRIREKYPDTVFRIPMADTVRSLNLATAAGIVLYEAIRQLAIALEAPRACRADGADAAAQHVDQSSEDRS
jgi:tRNA (cytidine/uridine-2'-O-)-methyltransferase